jgi:DNA-binding protein H-NS
MRLLAHETQEQKMARANGLDKLSVAQLIDLQKRIEVAIVERKGEEARDVKEKMQALAEKSGFSLAELFGSKRDGKRGPAAIKYRNPKNTSQTWTGRGRKPNWLVDAVKKGAKIETFSV